LTATSPSPCIAIHVEPSFAYHALIVLPERVNQIHVGATPATAILLLVPPALLRHCIAMPFSGGHERGYVRRVDIGAPANDARPRWSRAPSRKVGDKFSGRYISGRLAGVCFAICSPHEELNQQ
jgi:hypothetical protein